MCQVVTSSRSRTSHSLIGALPLMPTVCTRAVHHKACLQTTLSHIGFKHMLGGYAPAYIAKAHEEYTKWGLGRCMHKVKSR